MLVSGPSQVNKRANVSRQSSSSLYYSSSSRYGRYSNGHTTSDHLEDDSHASEFRSPSVHTPLTHELALGFLTDSNNRTPDLRVPTFLEDSDHGIRDSQRHRSRSSNRTGSGGTTDEGDSNDSRTFDQASAGSRSRRRSHGHVNDRWVPDTGESPTSSSITVDAGRSQHHRRHVHDCEPSSEGKEVHSRKPFGEGERQHWSRRGGTSDAESWSGGENDDSTEASSRQSRHGTSGDEWSSRALPRRNSSGCGGGDSRPVHEPFDRRHRRHRHHRPRISPTPVPHRHSHSSSRSDEDAHRASRDRSAESARHKTAGEIARRRSDGSDNGAASTNLSSPHRHSEIDGGGRGYDGTWSPAGEARHTSAHSSPSSTASSAEAATALAASRRSRCSSSPDSSRPSRHHTARTRTLSRRHHRRKHATRSPLPHPASLHGEALAASAIVVDETTAAPPLPLPASPHTHDGALACTPSPAGSAHSASLPTTPSGDRHDNAPTSGEANARPAAAPTGSAVSAPSHATASDACSPPSNTLPSAARSPPQLPQPPVASPQQLPTQSSTSPGEPGLLSPLSTAPRSPWALVTIPRMSNSPPPPPPPSGLATGSPYAPDRTARAAHAGDLFGHSAGSPSPLKGERVRTRIGSLGLAPLHGGFAHPRRPDAHLLRRPVVVKAGTAPPPLPLPGQLARDFRSALGAVAATASPTPSPQPSTAAPVPPAISPTTAADPATVPAACVECAYSAPAESHGLPHLPSSLSLGSNLSLARLAAAVSQAAPLPPPPRRAAVTMGTLSPLLSSPSPTPPPPRGATRAPSCASLTAPASGASNTSNTGSIEANTAAPSAAYTAVTSGSPPPLLEPALSPDFAATIYGSGGEGPSSSTHLQTPVVPPPPLALPLHRPMPPPHAPVHVVPLTPSPTSSPQLAEPPFGALPSPAPPFGMFPSSASATPSAPSPTSDSPAEHGHSGPPAAWPSPLPHTNGRHATTPPPAGSSATLAAQPVGLSPLAVLSLHSGDSGGCGGINSRGEDGSPTSRRPGDTSSPRKPVAGGSGLHHGHSSSPQLHAAVRTTDGPASCRSPGRSPYRSPRRLPAIRAHVPLSPQTRPTAAPRASPLSCPFTPSPAVTPALPLARPLLPHPRAASSGSGTEILAPALGLTLRRHWPCRHVPQLPRRRFLFHRCAARRLLRAAPDFASGAAAVDAASAYAPGGNSGSCGSGVGGGSGNGPAEGRAAGYFTQATLLSAATVARAAEAERLLARKRQLMAAWMRRERALTAAAALATEAHPTTRDDSNAVTALDVTGGASAPTPARSIPVYTSLSSGALSLTSPASGHTLAAAATSLIPAPPHHGRTASDVVGVAHGLAGTGTAPLIQPPPAITRRSPPTGSGAVPRAPPPAVTATVDRLLGAMLAPPISGSSAGTVAAEAAAAHAAGSLSLLARAAAAECAVRARDGRPAPARRAGLRSGGFLRLAVVPSSASLAPCVFVSVLRPTFVAAPISAIPSSDAAAFAAGQRSATDPGDGAASPTVPFGSIQLLRRLPDERAFLRQRKAAAHRSAANATTTPGDSDDINRPLRVVVYDPALARMLQPGVERDHRGGISYIAVLKSSTLLQEWLRSISATGPSIASTAATSASPPPLSPGAGASSGAAASPDSPIAPSASAPPCCCGPASAPPPSTPPPLSVALVPARARRAAVLPVPPQFQPLADLSGSSATKQLPLLGMLCAVIPHVPLDARDEALHKRYPGLDPDLTVKKLMGVRTRMIGLHRPLPHRPPAPALPDASAAPKLPVPTVTPTTAIMTSESGDEGQSDGAADAPRAPRPPQQAPLSSLDEPMGLDVSTIATAYAYFEELVRREHVVRAANRRLVAACCVTLATKFHEPDRTLVRWLIPRLEEVFRVSRRDIFAHEMWVFVQLDMNLWLPPKQVAVHYNLMLQLVGSSMPLYLGADLFARYFLHGERALGGGVASGSSVLTRFHGASTPLPVPALARVPPRRADEPPFRLLPSADLVQRIAGLTSSCHTVPLVASDAPKPSLAGAFVPPPPPPAPAAESGGGGSLSGARATAAALVDGLSCSTPPGTHRPAGANMHVAGLPPPPPRVPLSPVVRRSDEPATTSPAAPGTAKQAQPSSPGAEGSSSAGSASELSPPRALAMRRPSHSPPRPSASVASAGTARDASFWTDVAPAATPPAAPEDQMPSSSVASSQHTRDQRTTQADAPARPGRRNAVTFRIIAKLAAHFWNF